MKNKILISTLLLILTFGILPAQVQVRFEANPYQVQFFEYSKSDKLEIDYQTKIDVTEVESILARAFHVQEYNNSKGYFITGEGYDKYLENYNNISGPAMPLDVLPKLYKGLKFVPIYKVRLLKNNTERVSINVEIFYENNYVDTYGFHGIKTEDGWKRLPDGIHDSKIGVLVSNLNPKAFRQLFIEQKGDELITELLEVGKNPFNDQLWLDKIYWYSQRNAKKFKSLKIKPVVLEGIWWKKYVE